MNADYKFAKAVSRLYGRTTSESVCSSCQRSLIRRQYASAATASAVQDQPSNPPTPPSKPVEKSAKASSALRPAYQLKAGVVLSRPPQITRDLSPFERAFYLYQRRLNERLALPFTRYFYYKRGTPADVEWKTKIKDRLTPARDIGVYHAYGKQGWNDEVLVGAQESEPDYQMEKLLVDAETSAAAAKEQQQNASVGASAEGAAQQAKAEELARPMPRLTEADKAGDVKSLDRMLQRTLFLLVKGEKGRWTFPSARLLEKENLHQAAERVIIESAGPNMNTWIVGNAPIGHYVYPFFKAEDNKERGTSEIGEKVFFMKSRIMAGQANVVGNKLGLQDFQWATKEEVQKLVTPKYWSMTQDMLMDR